MPPSYSSLNGTAVNATRNELIAEYFNAGYTYSEIILILFHKHRIIISLRQLNRVLQSQGLRRNGRAFHEEMLVALQNEINGTGSCLGYRTMTQRLMNRHGLLLPRSVVLEFQRLLDPEGVANRRSNSLQRRAYVNKGPNFLIHIDGYDKLKQYGFAIHGAICGYSRRILWLNVANTNNDPAVVASYFMRYVKEIKGVPRCLRCDAGTENVLIEDIQKAFRWHHTDDMTAERCVVIGSSKSNQRIEQWWRWARQRGCQFWLDAFAELETVSGVTINVELARFCFMALIQQDLDNLRAEWNQHTVRQHRLSGAPCGKPDIMFHLPRLYDTVDYKVEVDMADVENIIREWCTDPKPFGCSENVVHLFCQQMRRIGLSMPSTFQQGLELYEMLRGAVSQL